MPARRAGDESERVAFRIPRLSRIGSNSPPNARIVTPEPPVNVVKNAQASAVTRAGRLAWCRQRSRIPERDVATRALGEDVAASVNNGIAGRDGFTTVSLTDGHCRDGNVRAQ